MSKQIALAWLSCGILLVFFQNCDSHEFSTAATPLSSATAISITAPGSSDAASSGGASLAILTDRYYMNSLFLDVFGPTFPATDTTNMRLDASNHGSPCSLYEDYTQLVAGVWTQVDPMASCSASSQSLLTATANPNASVTRQALLTHACSDLTTNNTTFAYALAQIGTGVPAVNSTTLSAAVHMFYRSQPDPSESVMSALAASFPDPNNPTSDDWRSTLFIICSSSYWQVL